ncbi:MAG: YHS domain-containing protein [Candidatus Brocadiales bacterium]
MKGFTYSLAIFAFMLVMSLCSDRTLQDCTAETAAVEHKSKHAEEKVFDPVCEMRVKKDKARIGEFEGKLYYFCSYECRDKFDGDPYKFACPCRGQIHPECVCEHCEGEAGRCKCPQAEEISPFQLRGKKAFDPVCGMTVGKEKAVSYGYHGFVYYFCSTDCRAAFSMDPYQFACLCSTEHTNCVCDHCEEKTARCECRESKEAKRLYREERSRHEEGRHQEHQ